MKGLLQSSLAALFGIVVAVAGVSAHAQYGGDRSGDVAGRFDYYLLSLSWSPSYCAEEGMADRDPRQCGRDRKFSFVVHGLWPQNERGWPSDCAARERDAPPALAASMLDIMPSPRLVEHEWDSHGKCSGLSSQAYFDLTRRVRTGVVIPAAYRAPAQTLMVTGAEVERAFVAANPRITPAMIAVQCDRTRLREVRICVTKDGRPRACGADVRDKCGQGRVAMPPVRAGH
jgi:ribonuclease T2